MSGGILRVLGLAVLLPVLSIAQPRPQQAPDKPLPPPAPFYAQPMDDAEAARLAVRVREETRHA